MKNTLYARYFIALGLSVVGILVTWVGTLRSQVLMWIGIGIIAIGVIVSWTIRCPRCGHNLMGKRQLLLPNFCPNCGHNISESELE